MGTPSERLAALEKRSQLLDQSRALFEDWLSLAMQNRLQMAKLYTATDPARAAAKMGEAIQFAEQLGDSGQYLSHAVFQATSDYLMHTFAHPQFYRQGDSGKIREVVEKNIKAYDSQKQAQPVWDFQKRKIKMLWAALLGQGAQVRKARSTGDSGPGEVIDAELKGADKPGERADGASGDLIVLRAVLDPEAVSELSSSAERFTLCPA